MHRWKKSENLQPGFDHCVLSEEVRQVRRENLDDPQVVERIDRGGLIHDVRRYAMLQAHLNEIRQERLRSSEIMSTIEFENGEFSVDAGLIAEGLGLEPSQVQSLMRERKITTLCERGEDADAGRFRLTFFHDQRRLRLVVDGAGKVLERSLDAEPKPSEATLRARSPRS